MSKARVDLPEPETPVTTENDPRGIRAERCRRLCSQASTISMSGEGVAMAAESTTPPSSPARPRAVPEVGKNPP